MAVPSLSDRKQDNKENLPPSSQPSSLASTVPSYHPESSSKKKRGLKRRRVPLEDITNLFPRLPPLVVSMNSLASSSNGPRVLSSQMNLSSQTIRAHSVCKRRAVNAVCLRKEFR